MSTVMAILQFVFDVAPDPGVLGSRTSNRRFIIYVVAAIAGAAVATALRRRFKKRDDR
jgi:hypothetical protein